MENLSNERESRFLEMIRTMRPDMSKAWRAFCAQYLTPVFGEPDSMGNYLLRIGDNPRVLFAAHSDTVHKSGGMQKIQIAGGFVKLHPKSKSNCLGADCTTGVHIILEMIRANVPGLYAIFAAEEIGCAGSRDFVKRRKADLAGIDCVISLDRKGYGSIITHQMGKRTASDQFAESLAGILGMNLKADDTGSYTDSNEFRDHISECTNLSVGYFGQHTGAEYQDLDFLETLTERMIQADWSQLKTYRDQNALDLGEFDSLYDWRDYRKAGKAKQKKSGSYDSILNYRAAYDQWASDELTMRDLVREYPNAIADWLEDNGINVGDLQNELGISNGARGSNYGG